MEPAMPPTFLAEGPFVGRAGAVTEITVVLLHTFAAIVTEITITATVSRTARLDSRGHFSPLFQVQFLPI